MSSICHRLACASPATAVTRAPPRLDQGALLAGAIP